MSLNPLDIINGTFSLTFVVISLIIGFLILSRYFKYKEKIYFLVGMTWILISEPWWPSSLSFLVSLNNGEGLTPALYFLVGNTLVPLAIALWLIAFTEFILTEKRKIILIAFSVLGILFEIIFFILLYVNPNLIGTLTGTPPVDVSYKSFIMIFLLFFILIVVITGLFFARLSLKSKDKEVNLKGKLLVVAYITFLIGSILDSSLPLNELTVIFTRLLLIVSAICWYGGFLLPKWMKKLFLKKK